MSAKQTGTNQPGKTGGEHDHYETPKWCVDVLFHRLDLANISTGLEPCRGVIRRPIYRRLVNAGILTDWYEIQEGRNYLAHDARRTRCQLGITNPPFRQSLAFTKHMLIQCDTVIILQRLNWLGSRRRHQFWLTSGLTHMIVLSDRPSFTDDGKTDAESYAWYCWDRLGIVQGPPFQWGIDIARVFRPKHPNLR